MESSGDADAALLQAAIELFDEETATDRASFYAYARRGRPQADAEVSRAIEVRHRGQAYRVVVSQLAPGRYRAEVDGTAVDAGVERLSPHERRITIGGRTHRTLISRQGADLLVEVHGVPLVMAWLSAAFIIVLNGALLWQVAFGDCVAGRRPLLRIRLRSQ